MKKKLFSLAVICICLSVVSAGTLAYYTANETAHNVITSGGVNIEVVEQMQNGDTLIDFPAEGISGVMPGTSVSKIVRVENTGASDAWIRVKVSEKMTSAEGADLSAGVMTYKVKEGWIDGGDGYYYYNEPVAPADSTDVLFETVNFDAAMGNEYQNCTANILIYAEAVQSANNAIPENGDVTDIQGWPTAVENE